MKVAASAILLSAALLVSGRADTILNPSGIPLGGTATFAVSVNPPALPDTLLVWRQACVSFRIAGFESVTNDLWLRIPKSNGMRPLGEALVDHAHGTGGLECYFVDWLEDANGANFEGGTVVSTNGNARTVAHELGHAFGFYDVYDQYDGAPFSVTGGVARAGMEHDWGSASDEGVYPSGLQQADLVKRLLMYGYSSPVKADIPYGDVTGLWYESVWDSTNHVWLKDWHLSPAYVGFFLHYNPYPHHR